MALNGQYSLGTVCRVRHVSGHEHAFKSRAQPGNTILNAEIGAGAARAAITQPWIFHPRLIVMQLFSCAQKVPQINKQKAWLIICTYSQSHVQDIFFNKTADTIQGEYNTDKSTEQWSTIWYIYINSIKNS